MSDACSLIGYMLKEEGGLEAALVSFSSCRSCVNCGAQRQFNLGNWEMQGHFYYGQPQRHQITTV